MSFHYASLHYCNRNNNNLVSILLSYISSYCWIYVIDDDHNIDTLKSNKMIQNQATKPNPIGADSKLRHDSHQAYLKKKIHKKGKPQAISFLKYSHNKKIASETKPKKKKMHL